MRPAMTAEKEGYGMLALAGGGWVSASWNLPGSTLSLAPSWEMPQMALPYGNC